MAVITTGDFAKMLWPGLNSFWGLHYKDHEQEWRDIFEVQSSKRAYEEDLGLQGFGIAPKLAEGAPVSYDTSRQVWIKRYISEKYGIGFIITEEMLEDNQYQSEGRRRAKALGRSMKLAKEHNGANVLNRGFNAGFAGPDGLPLFSTAHLLSAGGTQQNTPTTASDISEGSLEQTWITVSRWKDDRNLEIAVKPKCLIVPPELYPDTCRILDSDLQSGTANNDVNFLKNKGIFPEGIKVNHYLSDTDAWFVLTDQPDGLKHIVRREPKFEADNDFDTSNVRFKCTERYTQSWTDWRGAHASPGA